MENIPSKRGRKKGPESSNRTFRLHNELWRLFDALPGLTAAEKLRNLILNRYR